MEGTATLKHKHTQKKDFNGEYNSKRLSPFFGGLETKWNFFVS